MFRILAGSVAAIRDTSSWSIPARIVPRKGEWEGVGIGRYRSHGSHAAGPNICRRPHDQVGPRLVQSEEAPLNRWKNPTMVIAVLALFVALGGGAALAGKSISGKSIKNHSMPLNKLTNSAIHALSGKQGPQGSSGPSGPKGPSGPSGPSGPKGASGPKGSPGPTGAVGPTGAAGVVPVFNTGGTLQAAQHAVSGTFTMPNTNGPSTVTLSNSAAFISASSYFCAIDDSTTANAQAMLVKTSGTAFTLKTTGPLAMNDVIDFICL